MTLLQNADTGSVCPAGLALTGTLSEEPVQNLQRGGQTDRVSVVVKGG